MSYLLKVKATKAKVCADGKVIEFPQDEDDDIDRVCERIRHQVLSLFESAQDTVIFIDCLIEALKTRAMGDYDAIQNDIKVLKNTRGKLRYSD